MMRISLPPVVSQWTLIQDMVDNVEKDNPNINDLFEDTRGLFAGKSCHQISSSRSSDLAYDDFSDDLPMYRVPATPKVEISSYCFG
jgi:hypothetical protein